MRESGAAFETEDEKRFARRAGVDWGQPRGNRVLQVVALLFLVGSLAVKVLLPEGAPHRLPGSITLMVAYCVLGIAVLIRQWRYRRTGARRA